MEFEGEWKAAFGKPDVATSILIWGGSSSGKTSLALQLAKYLTRFGRVAYDSLEEGVSFTIQNAMRAHKMSEVGGRFILLDREPWGDLLERMKKHKSPKYLFIDSIQYASITVAQYKEMKELLQEKKKGLIIISHAKGNEPKGALAEFIRYDVDIKCPVKGYRAYPEGRLYQSEGSYFDVWPEKSAIAHGDII